MIYLGELYSKHNESKSFSRLYKVSAVLLPQSLINDKIYMEFNLYLIFNVIHIFK